MKKILLIIGGVILVMALTVVSSFTVLKLTGNLQKEAVDSIITPSTPDKQKEFGPIVEAGEYTVNLQDGDNFLKVEISLELADKAASEKFKELLPVVKNQVIDVISVKTLTNVQSPMSKEALREELKGKLNDALGQSMVKSVLFTGYVYQ